MYAYEYWYVVQIVIVRLMNGCYTAVGELGVPPFSLLYTLCNRILLYTQNVQRTIDNTTRNHLHKYLINIQATILPA